MPNVPDPAADAPLAAPRPTPAAVAPWIAAPPRFDVGGAWARYRLGARYALLGVRLVVGHRALWPLVLAPALVNLSLLLGAAFAAAWAIPWLLSWLWAPDPTQLGLAVRALWLAAQVLLVGAAVLIAAVGVYFVSGLVATPFLDRLSEKVETMVLGPYDEPTSLRVQLGDLLVSAAHTALGLTLWAVVMAALLLLNLVPVAGAAVELVLSVLATALFVSRETMDGAMSRRRLSFAHKVRVVWRHKALFQGFGQVSAAMLWVPLLNFLALPMAVAGGTLLFCHLELRDLVPDARGEGPLRSERRRRNHPEPDPTAPDDAG